MHEFFSNIGNIEPHCPKCNIKIEYEVTTKWDNKKQAHFCINCGHKV